MGYFWVGHAYLEEILGRWAQEVTLDSGRMFRRKMHNRKLPGMAAVTQRLVSCRPPELWPSLTLFFSTRPAVWYRTGPA